MSLKTIVCSRKMGNKATPDASRSVGIFGARAARRSPLYRQGKTKLTNIFVLFVDEQVFPI